MELIQHLCERDIFKQSTKQKTNSLENLASKQRIFRIVKEQHGSCSPCDRKIAPWPAVNAPTRNNLNIAPVRS